MQDFEQPIVTENFRHDFSKNPLDKKPTITFSAGKLEQVSAKMYFEGKLPKEELLCGFKWYDPEAKEKKTLDRFTAFVLGVYYGSFSNGKERGEINFQSNLVTDTRQDVLHSFYFLRDGDDYKIKTLALGHYATEIKPAIEREGRGSSYTKVIVAYIQELDDIRAIHLGATAEAGFVKAIAQSQGQPEHKASLYRIGELASEIWAFRFEGEFEPVVFSPKEKKNVGLTMPAEKGAKAIFFQPVIKAGVIRQTSEKWRDMYEKVAALHEEFTDYLESEQTYYRERLTKGTGATSQSTPARENETPQPPQQKPVNRGNASEVPFPPDDITSYPENGNGDDLPF